MYKLKEKIKAEIDDIVSKPLSVSSLGVLGELVDIYKDAEYIEYMHCKEEHMSWEEHSESSEKLTDTSIAKISDSIVDYKEARKQFLSNRNAATKQKLLNTLQDVMDSYSYAIHDTWNGCNTEEEKAVIRESVSKKFLS